MKYVWKILTVVEHGLGEKLAGVTREAGARGGTIRVGRGELNSPILQALALADVERDLLITLVTDDELEPVLHAIVNAPFFKRGRGGKANKKGETFVVPMGGRNMTSENEYEMISVIVNRGYADDIMKAARKAGARGGTIFNARGTGKPDDEKFFGITVVPEKEELVILAERATAPAILEAIEKLPCLTTPGIGIMFETPVSSFVTLGGKSKK
jgi:nitrogen regulatory protein PII